MNPFSLITGFVEGVGNVVVKGIRAVKGDQAERDQQDAGFGMAGMAQFASESMRTPTTWWDSLIDGLNRLPRPMLTFSVIGLMAYCPIDPVGFAEIMNAYNLVPEWLWGIMITIVGFYFAVRHLEERIKLAGPKPEQIKAFVEGQERLVELRRKIAKDVEPEVADADLKREMADTSKPMSNAAIEEWNRRRRKS